MQIDVSKEQDVTVVVVDCENSHAGISHVGKLERRLFSVAETASPPCIVLDVSALQSFGASFLSLLLRMKHCVTAVPQGRFAVSGLTPMGLEIVHVTRLDKVLHCFSQRAVAVAAVSDCRQQATRASA